MRAARTFLQSPLARRPRLFARKVASRLQLYREDVPVPPPPVSDVVYPPHWAPTLRTWIGQVRMQPGPHPFHRVFGQDFDETLLLRLCREGPQRGATGLLADVKLIWDYSRGHALFTNAAAGSDHLGPCTGFLRRWMEANADTNGFAWTCAMEVAIRAVNWIFADTLFDGALGRAIGRAEWARWLWRHGYLIWRRLEARLVSSNHYLADLLGLLVTGSVFQDDPQARTWRRFAASEFPRAMLTQTRRDGGLNEASLRYHAYATEMALLFRLALGAPLPHAAEVRLRAMCRIVADFRSATGDVFPIGDDDSGRVLALDFFSTTGRAEVVLRLAAALLGEQFTASALGVYPESGWWVRRAGDFVVALEFGGVGLHGLGAHAHNDDLSFCLDWRGRPVITDPGTFLYTGDPAARNRFRSTFSHNTVILNDGEQRELSGGVFVLRGADKACEASCLGDDAWTFSRRVSAGVWHRREMVVSRKMVSIRDLVEGTGRHKLEWRFHLHPSVRAALESTGFALVVPGAGELAMEISGMVPAPEAVSSEFSPSYGCAKTSAACASSGGFSLPWTLRWRIQPQDS
jgi:hypothetical protein